MAIDLTLPETSSPAIDPYKEMPGELNPFALFVHIPFDDGKEVAEIERVCNQEARDGEDDFDDVVKRATPRFDFRDEPLRASVAYFIDTLLPTKKWDYFYFIAVVDEDWREKGVLMVTMDDGTNEDEAHIDICRVPAAESGLNLMNLQISNMDWEEYKDAEDGSDEEDED
ncbi:hypothetical protein CC79DRAFT_1334299 [Sarocladium strictum]